MKDSSPKHYLITGGSGFLGINLVRYLLSRGHQISSVDLVPFDYRDCKDLITDIRADIRDADAMQRAMKDVDIVIHCAAALPLYKPEDIYSTDIDGTRNVMQAALDNGVERAVHISSTAVYGVPDHHPLFEDDPMEGVGPYGIAKVKAEEVCLEFRDKGLCIPILRPKSFIGAERLGVFAMLYEWAYEGHNWPILGKGNNLYQYLDVEDFCDAIYLSCTLDRSITNDTFNLGAREFGTVASDFQAVLDEAGYGKHVVPIPAAPAIWTLRFLEALGLSPLYKWVYETVVEDSFVGIEKAVSILGYTPRYSNKDALLRNYHWYVRNLDTIKATSGVSHRVPWKQGALSLAKLIF